VVEKVILKWSHEVKSPGIRHKCLSTSMSNISTSGDVAITVSKKDNFGEITLFNNDGKITWNKQYSNIISNPQLSDDGNILAVQVGSNTLMAYDKKGKLLWTYSIEKKAEKSEIEDYKLSRDGRYAVIAVTEKGSFGLKSYFILLREGAVEWVKSDKSEACKIAISPNNEYVVSASCDIDKRYTRAALYTIDGAEHWNTVIKGIPRSIDVSDNGEVLLTNVDFYPIINIINFIAKGRVLWAKNDYWIAKFTRRGDRIIAVGIKSNDVCVFDRKGELLWNYRGAHSFAVSDNYYVLYNLTEIVLVTAEGEVIQHIKLSESEKVEIYNVEISPDGKYFAIRVEDKKEGMCHLYFFENRDPLIRGVKEKLLKEIDELIKE